MWQGFKKFIVRGNVVDLAVGVIIGAAFGAIVKSMVEDVVTPTIGMLGERAKFINALLNFLVQATVVYFFIVVPINKLLDRLKKDEPKALPDDIKLLTEIRDLLKAQSGRPGSSAEGVA
jgi:large conductance mechanosensitive channel